MSNPYIPSAAYSLYAARQAGRPGGLVVVCVIAIILSSLGLLGSLVTLASLAAGPRLQQAIMAASHGKGHDESMEFQRAMQQKLQAVTDRYRWPNVGFALFNLVLASSMLTGAIKVLKRAAGGRKLLITVFAVVLLFEISRSIVVGFMQWEMACAMSGVLPPVMEAAAPAANSHAPAAAAMGAAFASVGIIIGLAFNLLLSLARLIFYAVGWWYLCRPAVRQWLAGAGQWSPGQDAAAS